MLKKSSLFSNSFGGNNKKHEILMTLTTLQWNELQDAETFADLQEELEEIADIQLIEPNKLKIIATSEAWVLRHIINGLLNEIDLSKAEFVSVETEHAHYHKPSVYVNIYTVWLYISAIIYLIFISQIYIKSTESRVYICSRE